MLGLKDFFIRYSLQMRIYYLYTYIHALSCVWLFTTPWTIGHQASLSMEFFRQECWSGVAIPFPGGSFWPGDQTQISHIAGRFFNVWAIREAHIYYLGSTYFWILKMWKHFYINSNPFMGLNSLVNLWRTWEIWLSVYALYAHTFRCGVCKFHCKYYLCTWVE